MSEELIRALAESTRLINEKSGAQAPQAVLPASVAPSVAAQTLTPARQSTGHRAIPAPQEQKPKVIADPEAEKILRFWRDVELLNVNQTPKTERTDVKNTATYRKGDPLPWEEGHKNYRGMEGGHVWFHKVHIGIGSRRDTVENILKSTCGDEPIDQEELQRMSGACWSFAVLLDWEGRPVRESYTPASFAVAGNILRRGGDMRKVMSTIAAMQAYFLEDHPDSGKTLDPEGTKPDEKNRSKQTIGERPLNWDDFAHELKWRDSLVGSGGLDMPDIVVESVRVRRAEPGNRQDIPDAPFLNSFYVQDLERLIDHATDGTIGRVLASYIGKGSDPFSRVDLLTDTEALIDAVRPSRLSRGRWPSNSEHSLAIGQQAAVAEALFGESDLIAVNGPPGTGKTTLCRDIIADVVVERARRISMLSRPQDLFDQEGSHVGNNRLTYLNQDVMRGTGIVVTSANNGAVENISLELPRQDSISKEFGGAGYFRQTAQAITDEKEIDAKSWGLISAALGTKSNCWDYFKPLLKYTDGSIVKMGLPASLPSVMFDKASQAQGQWSMIRDEFRRTYDAIDNRLKDLDREHLSLKDDRGAVAHTGNATKPDARFRGKDHDERQLTSLWTDPILEKWRSRLFLLGLKLMESTLTANARIVQSNLRAARDVILGLNRDQVNHNQVKACWDSVFMVSPVVSTTLASFNRMFGRLEDGDIGWVLIDEAGQAEPQAVAGALSRARRAVVIGDPLQIEPVQTIPTLLIEHLRKMEGIGAEFSPALTSAQAVADRTMNHGGNVFSPDGMPIWTGVPLRAHRRCAEPMFSIANTIAYSGQMVQAGSSRKALNSRMGESCWYDVRGSDTDGHIVKEELAFLERMMTALKRQWPSDGDRKAEVFVITPFKRVQTAAEQLIARLDLDNRVKCGTVHAFQGKEADIVVMVLGSMPGQEGKTAREWAAATPNILNVALTRAKARFHVIGSIEDWSQQAFFDKLAQQMMEAGRVLVPGRPVQRDQVMVPAP